MKAKQSQRIVVVGGGYTGVVAAIRAARKIGKRGNVTLVSAAPELVERVRLHEAVARRRAVRHPLPRVLRGTRVQLVVAAVESVNLDHHLVVAGETCIPYDRLLLAPGSQIERDRVPGVREHAFVLEPDATEELNHVIAEIARRGGRVVICGGGLTGIELSSELAEAFPALQVSLVTNTLGERTTDEVGRNYVASVLRGLRVDLRLGVRIEAVRPGSVVTSAGAISCDACIWTGGFAASPLPRALGLAVNGVGQALVDPMLRSVTDPRVYVAGDAAAPVVDPGSPAPMGCKIGMAMGAQAADNMVAGLVGRAEQPFDWRYPVRCTSLGRRRGMVELMNADGTPSPRRLTGRMGAFLKEQVNRSALWGVKQERIGLPYWWPRTGHAPATCPPVRAAVAESPVQGRLAGLQ